MSKIEIDHKVGNLKTVGYIPLGLSSFTVTVDDEIQKHYEARLYPLALHIEASNKGIVDVKLVIFKVQIGIYGGPV